MSPSYDPMAFGGLAGRRVPAAAPFVMPNYNAPPGPWQNIRPTTISPITGTTTRAATNTATQTAARQGTKGLLRTGGRLLGPLSNAGLGGIEVYQAAQEGRNPWRQAAKTATEMTAGGLAVAGGALVGVPTTGPVGAAASIGLYAPTSMGAGAIFDAMWPEQTPRKDDTVYGRRPGKFVPKEGGGVEFVGGEDLIGPVPQPRTGKGTFVVVPKEEGGGIRWDPNAAQVPPGTPIRPDRETPITTPVTPENGNLTTPINLDAPLPDPQLAPTPAENAGAMDPYAYQLQVYGQGRQKASSQESQAAVRDLGLAIHQRLYPQFYADKENIPTTEVQNPNSMNFKDATRELEASTLAVEELIDPEILQQLNAMNLRRTGY